MDRDRFCVNLVEWFCQYFLWMLIQFYPKFYVVLHIAWTSMLDDYLADENGDILATHNSILMN